MTPAPSADLLVGTFRNTVASLVREDGHNLSARQLGVFLTCYLDDGLHTVRGLAAELNVSKPAITRALDRLGEFDLARRKTDPVDRRSVLVQRTAAGQAFLRGLSGMVRQATELAKIAASDTGIPRRHHGPGSHSDHPLPQAGARQSGRTHVAKRPS